MRPENLHPVPAPPTGSSQDGRAAKGLPSIRDAGVRRCVAYSPGVPVILSRDGRQPGTEAAVRHHESFSFFLMAPVPSMGNVLVVALSSLAGLLLLRLARAEWLRDRIPLLLPLVVAVLVACWCGGFRAGLIVTVMGCMLEIALRRYLPASDCLQLGLFLVVGLAISTSFGVMHHARRRLERKQQQLEEEVRERKRIDQELVETDRRKNEFLATLAHELRQPLAPIRNCLEIVRRSHDDAGLREQSHRMMDRQVQQMTRLVDDLLDLSRLGCNRFKLRKKAVALAKVVQSAAETSQPLIQASAHELTISLPHEPILLDADPVRLTQVFANLLNNAAKYMERGGHIWLTAEKRETAVVVKIRDTGIGIPADMLERIFEMFTQLDEAPARAPGGFGIGLSLVRHLTEMHGGRVEARSDGPGRGSEFVVCLPVLF